ncbi:PAB-dependent poly(A)-specific ribonuclease subunit 3 [Coemansia sp. S155-1]|nr:PAB-dependent poly(A)-specific ribonuclease subunit 3 [Coemansia sp. S155-1]
MSSSSTGQCHSTAAAAHSASESLITADNSGNKAQSPALRAQTPVKLRASSPAFKPSPIKNRKPSSVASASSSQLRLAPAFTPRQQPRPRQLDEQRAEGGTKGHAQVLPAFESMSVGSDGCVERPPGPINEEFFMKTLPAHTGQPPYMLPANHFAVDEQLRRVLVRETHAMSSVGESDLPAQVHSYHSLSPQETVDVFGASFPIRQHQIKAQSIADGRCYSLHRITGTQPASKSALGAIDKWKAVQSPSIAQVYEAFTTRAFGDNSLVIVHELKPLAASLKSQIVDARAQVSEAFLWSLVLQLISALRTVHSAGLAVQTLSVSTILLSPTNRVYLNSCGLADVLALRGSLNMDAAQQGDLQAVGHVLSAILGTSAENYIAVQGQAPVVVPGAGFSPDFKELFGYLNHRLTPVVAIDDILRLAGSRVFVELDAARRESDLLCDNLRLELSNGRLVRLLCKINFITERADSVMDPEWAETGDRYLIKLFRDYVFHLVNEAGKPVASMAHVVGNLNKLDAGSPEKVMLMSRDEKSCLVVSYEEVKRCVEEAYQELVAPTRR